MERNILSALYRLLVEVTQVTIKEKKSTVQTTDRPTTLIPARPANFCGLLIGPLLLPGSAKLLLLEEVAVLKYEIQQTAVGQSKSKYMNRPRNSTREGNLPQPSHFVS